MNYEYKVVEFESKKISKVQRISCFDMTGYHVVNVGYMDYDENFTKIFREVHL